MTIKFLATFFFVNIITLDVQDSSEQKENIYELLVGDSICLN
mgnify:CR=1 FL=1